MRVRFDVADEGGRERFLRGDLPIVLRSLSTDTSPLWGRMTPQQMVEHLLWAFDASNGRITVACPLPEERQNQVRGFLRTNRPTPLNFENPLLVSGLPSLRFDNLSAACDALTEAARAFLDQSESERQIPRTHPLFGAMTAESWSRMHFKHCVHHLLQFRLIEVEEVPETEKPHA